MKLLRNPIVTGMLAVVALLVVGYQLFGAKLFRSRPAAPKSSVAAATPAARPAPQRAPATTAPKPKSPAQPSATQTNPESALLPGQEVDEAAAERGFKTWVAAPLRDPFLLFQVAAKSPGLFGADTNSPVPSWTLNAIWNQTDSRLAVIEDRVYRVGDVIEGYKLIRIEKDEVWFEGPNQNERLGFADPAKAKPPGKGQPKAKAKKK
jgi:hypothetical protein